MTQLRHAISASKINFVLLLTLVILLPRLLLLDSSVTPDEPKWLARSAHFYAALKQGESPFISLNPCSIQPGVTILWAGVAAFVWASGDEPLHLLIAARIFVVIINTLALVGAFLAARRLFGWWAAFVGASFIAFDPFHTALSRMLELDGLMASLMLLSLLTFLSYLNCGRRRVDLLLSGIAAGLAWLTKAPAFFLMPFMALIILAQLDDGTGEQPLGLMQAVKGLMGYALIGFVTYLLLWPALWVNPIDTIGVPLFSLTVEGDQGYLNSDLVREQQDFFFYPITYLWRTTPIVILGLLLACVAYLKKLAPLDKAETRQLTLVLLMYAIFFMLFMGLWSAKADRYLMPIYLPLDIVAALGWVALGQAVARGCRERRASCGRGEGLPPLFGQKGAWGLLMGGGGLAKWLPAVAILGQAFIMVSLFPHLMSYYNPLLGGGSQAAKTMMVGWGEGLDGAARYLNNKPNAEDLRVASWYHESSFSYFFKGQSLPLAFEGIKGLSNWLKTDYIVFYIQQKQRQLPSAEFVEYFTQQASPPEKVIRFGGIDYAQIYNLDHLEPPPFLHRSQPRFTDWGGAIRLLDYELRPQPFAQGAAALPADSFQTYFYLENLAPLQKNMSVLVRVVDQYGNELLRDEGWPFGSPTSEWKLHEIWRDGHDFTIPADAPTGYYRIMLSFYEPKTLNPLPAINTLTQEPIGDELLVDYLYVGNLPTPPTVTVPIELGSEIQWLGAKIGGMEREAVTKPGETLEVSLFWQTEHPMTQDVTVFVHLVGPDGLIAQIDQPPPVPIHLWRPNEFIVDQATLTIPSDIPPGTYELRVGMYDPATLQRLPVSQEGQAMGDNVMIGRVQVE